MSEAEQAIDYLDRVQAAAESLSLRLRMGRPESIGSLHAMRELAFRVEVSSRRAAVHTYRAVDEMVKELA